MTTRKYILLIALFSLGAAVMIAAKMLRRPDVLAKGCFHQVAHKASGCASLLQSSTGDIELEITDLSLTPSLDLEVVLTSAGDAFENDAVKRADRVSLGPLKPGVEYQKFPVPAGTNVSRLHSVTIWNTRYEVNFTTAPLRGE
jgi:hypothetical protein